MDKNTIRKIDLIVISLTLIALVILVGYTRPLVIAPVDGLITSNTSVLFSFEKAGIILIDDNQEFISPEKIYSEDNLSINLEPGVYYWKVEGVLQSEIRKLTINSRIDLKLKDAGDKYEVVNAGNTRLNVGVYNNTNLIGNVVLNVDESANLSGDKFLGRQYG